ncbi:Hsp70 family protein [Rhodococcus ruber]|uniref:Hsp70 family protein n=1 Tax=Rhodococcus ruber TaxID=1830 RepID=UPI00137604EA|nr:Hsp70 family protein [Rhodococcus ruber]MDO2378099.1 Hsp70 family protein [Rhodococcus ruber]
MTVVGFDFGTTNSLISIVEGNRVIDLVDTDGRSVPSVVQYEGTKTIVGRDAKEAMDATGLGVYANFITSPKTFLGDESIHVNGVERSPVDVVRDVVEHVKSQALRTAKRRKLRRLDGITRAVATIPVDMDGPRRAALRDAFGRAGIEVVQFVHEPFAALYGHFRLNNAAQLVREYDRRNILVVDWGGGTLDLTLCRLQAGRVIQMLNSGTDEVGGDRFDEAIRNEILSRACGSDSDVHPDARRRLLHACETHKIHLSTDESTTLYVKNFFPETGEPLEYRMTREKLNQWTTSLVNQGIGRIQALLDNAHIGESQVALCLVTGGMSAVPAIVSRLRELFGPSRVEVSHRSGTLIAQGAAWIAHDRQPLELARTVELELARGAHLPLLEAGTKMPLSGGALARDFNLYCADPRDGAAKFQLTTPLTIGSNVQTSDPRKPLGNFVVQVHQGARPFHERLQLSVEVDSNMVLHARASSSNLKDSASTTVHDLEFGITLGDSARVTNSGESDDEERDEIVHRRGDLVVRPNITMEKDDALVPGELLHSYNRSYFERYKNPPQVQVDEHLYYQPCAVCKRDSSDPACKCASTPTFSG